MDEKKIQQMFVQFLAQKSQQELEAKIQELGEEGLKAEYAEFQQVMAQQQTRKAMFGAKLNYIKGLKGQCPQGYEVKYYKQGGRVCAKCEAIHKQTQPQNPIDAFKCGRKMKKKACGGRMKKNQEGGEMTTKRPQRQGEYLDNGGMLPEVTVTPKGNYMKGGWSSLIPALEPGFPGAARMGARAASKIIPRRK